MKKEKPLAVALHYDGNNAPRIAAKGEGALARKIIATAREHGIPIEQNEELTALLSTVKLNDEIPSNLYVAVAQLLVFLYHVNEQKQQNPQD
ncbi:EscU/YscU/HrcU family type III secretion system export apparatus switch protein [Legionella fallonii]|uniref:Flagellar biosynthetic protein FlhB n=1 Tax=Legionella fallonii LLAP-10 TaxID=1212491 RepID=A0A098G5U7_9GAMM|nr:EscU/YscU/HrcU family type III secretion system export apparatus switch protein [Legionella fallonii]CEG57878.1 conserved protein of unknown function [Legionella fallonii LLAP-10]